MSTEAVETNETEVVDQAETTTAKVEAPKVETGVQKRIDQMTYRFREQERRANAAEARLAEYENKAKQAPAGVEAEKRKTLADFNFDEAEYAEYVEDRLTKRASETAAKEATKAIEEREQKKAKDSERETKLAKWQERQDKFIESHPDFDEVIEQAKSDGLRLSDALFELLADSEIGPQALMHLAQNPDESRRISTLSPAAAGREFGKLEARLEASKPADANASAATKEPSTSKAPPPPPKIEGSSGAIQPDEDKMSGDEWKKYREKQIAAKRKRA